MTDDELISAVQQTPADDLSLEQIDALREGLLRSPALRDALLERLQMEQYLGHALGRVDVSIDKILQHAEQAPAGNPTARLLYWGLALVLLLASGIGLYIVNRDAPGQNRLAQQEPIEKPVAEQEPPAGQPTADEKLAAAAATKATPASEPMPKPATEVAAAEPAAPWKLSIEAEDFSRGSAQTDDRLYGRHIGVIRAKSNTAAFAEYDVEVPRTGFYRLELRYAAAEATPLSLSINGELAKRGVAGETTGDWGAEAQRWFSEGVFTLKQGQNTLRLESDASKRRRVTFPSLDQLSLVAVDGPAAASATALAAAEPWQEVLAAAEPPPEFSAVCFDDFAQAGALRQAELSQWLTPVPGQSFKLREQLPACMFDGVARLASPWREDLALRLGLWDHHGLRIHLWSGQQGVTLWYYQYPAAWVAYRTQREGDQPLPKSFALAAQDDQRFARTSQGAFDLRWAEGRLWMTRGDLVLLSAALEQPPEEVYFEGHAGIRGLRLIRSSGLPETPAARPAVLASNQPATLAWRSDLPAGASLQKLAEGVLALKAEKTKSVASVSLPYPAPGFFEVVFQIEGPQPGTGVYLGNSQGKIEHKVAFLRDTRGGQTSLSFLPPADKRLESSEDINQRPAPYALPRHWIKLIVGCGAVKNLVSDDGLHFSRGDSPIQNAGGMKPCSTLGIYCQPTDEPRSIRVRSVEVRRLPALARLAPDKVFEAALALVGEGNWTLGDWLANVIDNQPAEIDPAIWRRACAIKTLQAGPPTPLAAAILMSLLDEVLAEPAGVEERLELLEEVALLAPTWSYDSRQLAVELARRYEALGQRLVQEGELRPYTAVSRALLAAPIATASAIPTFPEALVRQELLNLVQAERWAEALQVCRRAEYWNRPVAPGQRLFARESLGALVEWTRAMAVRHVADRPTTGTTAMRSEWRHPVVEVLSKEGYNILAEFNAALEGEAYPDACQIISSADPQGALGLLPDAKDSRLLVSLPAAVALAMREQPKLRQTMNEQFGPRGRLRVRQAIGEGNLLALEAATMQFSGTEAAAEAHVWLGDRALAGGDFLHAIGQYRLALDGNAQPNAVGPRLRLAAAMLGRDEGEKITQPVRFSDLDLEAEEFETLVAEMLARYEGADAAMMAALSQTSAGEIVAPRPASFRPQRWAEFHGDLGRDPQQTPYPAIDFAGQQLSTLVVEENDARLLLVNNRFQVIAYEMATGKERWAARLDKQQGYAHSWPLTPMQMVAAGGHLFTRRLTSRGPELCCLRLSDGKLLWTARPGDHVASDPIVAQDQLLAITAVGTQDNYLQMNLAAFDPRTGEILFQRPLLQLRDVWNRQVPCQATTIDDRILAAIGGSVVSCDLLGQVHWLRRELWLPKALDEDWEQQYVQPPLAADELVYIMQPGVRTVVCLEAATGRPRWQHVLPEIRRICGLQAEKLIVETSAGLEAFDAASGAVAWRRSAELLTAHACGEPGGVLIVENRRIDNELWRPALVWLDPATGQETGRTPLSALADKQPMVGPLVVYEDHLWAFFGRGGREAARDIYELVRQSDLAQVIPPTDGLDSWNLGLGGSLQYAAPAAAPHWRLLAGNSDKLTHWFPQRHDQENVLVTLASDKRPARFVRLLDLPTGARGKLLLKVGHEPEGQWGLDVRVGGDSLLSQTIDEQSTSDGWKELEVDLTPYAGRRQWLTVLHRSLGNKPSYASWQRLDLQLDPAPAEPPHGGE